MSANSQTDPYPAIVRKYVDGASVPPFDLSAIRRRNTLQANARREWRQYAVAAGVVAWSVPAFPALVAQVQNVLHMFLERDGQLVPAENRIVTIEQAARDLPFKVIAPRGVPLSISPTIREVGISGDPQSARLMIEYGPQHVPSGPALNIMETAASAPDLKLAIVARAGIAPPSQTGKMSEKDKIRLTMVEFTVSGTRVKLLSAPGNLTTAQLESIRDAMKSGSP